MAKKPVGYKSPFPMKSSPAKFVWLPWMTQAAIAAAPGIIKGVGSMMGGGKRRKEQKAAQEELATAKQDYMSTEFKNPYADIQNPYAGMENVYEDATVNTQAADYLKQQQQQSQANIMQGLKGAAGASGVAGLAQSMANIGSQQAQRASASIAQQEQANKQRAMAESSRLDKLGRTGQYKVDVMSAQGEHWKRKQELERKDNLYGLSLDRMSAADKARQTAKAGVISGFGSAVAGAAGAYPGGVGGGGEQIVPEFQQTVSTINDYNNNGINDALETNVDDIPGLPDYLAPKKI
jgi:hypothetical protein